MNNSTASSESTLRIFSSLFLLLAAIDIVQIVIKLMEKSIDINLMADTYYLTANVMNSNLLDFYIGIPTEDGFLFLFDVPKSGNYFEFGQLVPYNYYNKDQGDRVKAYLATIMSTDPPEEIIAGYENDTYTATACSPIYNSAGEPVAVVAVDLLMPNFKTEIQSALTKVRLRCDNKLMNYVIDRFGDDVQTITATKTQFDAVVNISVSQTFYAWVFQFAGGMRIMSPKPVREQYKLRL